MNWSSLKIKDDHIAFPISLLIRIRPYLIAAAGVVVATLIEMVFPHVFERASLFLYWPIVILTGWIGGFFPGLFAAVLAILFSNYYILPPRFAFTGDGLDLTILLLFVVITGFMAWLRDRQRQADELLYQKQQEMEVTLASIGDGVIVTDAEQIITFINAVAQKLTGWSEAEAVGKPIFLFKRRLNRARSSGWRIIRCCCPKPGKNGRSVTAQHPSAVPLVVLSAWYWCFGMTANSAVRNAACERARCVTAIWLRMRRILFIRWICKTALRRLIRSLKKSQDIPATNWWECPSAS
jgi:PAS domain-containing protein